MAVIHACEHCSCDLWLTLIVLPTSCQTVNRVQFSRMVLSKACNASKRNWRTPSTYCNSMSYAGHPLGVLHIRYDSAGVAVSAGGRSDLAEKEQAELAVLQSYLPKQMSREEVEGIVAAAVVEAGATSVKQMGAVMKIVTAKTAGAADNKTISELVKAALTPKKG
jgi:hypothetical protein